VEDTGLGISPQNIPKIFEGFHQIDATTSSQGVGLGLTIVKKYLGLMRGAIRVESEPGKGSKFRVTLPYILDT
jgi:signal transduction histidine kinase